MEENKRTSDSRLRWIILYLVAGLAGYAALQGGGIGEIPRWIISFLGPALLVLLLADRHRCLASPSRYTIIPWGLFFLWAILSSAFSADIYASAGELLTLAGVLSCGLIAAAAPASRKQIDRTILILLAGALAVTLTGWYFFLLGKFSVDAGPAMLKYFVGPFFWKNPMAGYFALFFPLATAAAIHYRKGYRIAAVVTATLMLGGLVLTRSRGGWIAAGAATALFLIPGAIRSRRKGKWLVLIIILVAGFALGLGMAESKSVSERAGSMTRMLDPDRGGRSTSERLTMLEAGGEIISDYPLLGVGPGAWPAVRASYLTDLDFLPRYPHNGYLRAVAETGIPGIILLAIAILATAIPIFLAAFRKRDIMHAGIAAAVAGVLLHIGVDFDAAFTGITLPLVVVTGLGLSISGKVDAKRRIPRVPIFIFGGLAILLSILRGAASVSVDSAAGALQRGELGAAESAAKSAARVDPLSWEARYYLYQISVQRGDLSEAKRYIEATLARVPTAPDFLSEKGKLLAQSGDSGAAISSFERALQAAPRADPETYFDLANLHRAGGDTEKAIKTLLSMTDRFRPFSGRHYTGPTAGFRYRVAEGWNRIADIARAEADTALFAAAADSFEKYSAPREKDRLLAVLGEDALSPEMTVVRLFEALAQGDTTEIRKHSSYAEGTTPHFPEGYSIEVTRILDVVEEPMEGAASVTVMMRHTSPEGSRVSRSRVQLFLQGGRWKVSFKTG